MTFKELVAARDAAIAIDDAYADAEHEAFHAHADAVEKHTKSSQERAAAHKAIHDLLAERGEHYLIAEDGTLTVFKPIDEEPGYLAVQPIPGQGPETSVK